MVRLLACHLDVLDLALDDFEKRVDPGFVLDAFRSGSAVTRAKRSRRIREEDRGGRRLGDGIQIGSRSGICFLRVYDKELESGGARRCIRWELQTKERAAEALLHDLVAHEEHGKVFAEHLVRFLDFRQPGLGAASVRPREPWFADLVGAAEKAVLAQPERTTSLASVLAWIHKQVVPLLGVIWHLSGRRNKEFLEVLDLDNAMYRWKPPHLKALKEGPEALQAHLDRPKPPAA